MSGVQIHTDDPISPTIGSDVIPKTLNNASPKTASATTNDAARYPPARPGAAAPTPTTSVGTATNSGPPPPQPGATPASQPPMTTARPSLPPPPKAGERSQSMKTQTQPYPLQMAQASMGLGPNEILPGSTKSTITEPIFPASAPPTSVPASAQTSALASLEHPPGYFQNPYASDLTPDQRFATELQEKENRSDSLPSLGYNDNARTRANSVVDDDESVWDAAKKWGTEGMNWGKEKGKQFGDWHEQVWGSIGRK